MTHRFSDWELTRNMDGRVDDAYLKQVDRATAKNETAFLQATRALNAAERRAARAQSAMQNIPPTGKARRRRGKEVEQAWKVVEDRRQELARLETLMRPVAPGTTHRGVAGYRGLPVQHDPKF